jgi:hypothetical protein
VAGGSTRDVTTAPSPFPAGQLPCDGAGGATVDSWSYVVNSTVG